MNEQIERAANAEIWLPVKGYEGRYEVSDQGRVRSLRYLGHVGKVQILKPGNTHGGYLQVPLCRDSQRKMLRVHRLVAEAFCPNPCPEKFNQVNHIDENKLNNAAQNLEWCDVKYNSNFGTRNDRIAKTLINHPEKSKQVEQLDKHGNLLATYPSINEAERLTRTNHSHICECCQGKLKSTGGYVWRYKEVSI